jgi:hypothetical protein
MIEGGTQGADIMTKLRSLGCYACIDKCVRSKGKQGNKSMGRTATRLKAKKHVKHGKCESAKTQKSAMQWIKAP